MPQLAGFRGVVGAPSRADIARDPARAMYRYHQVFSQRGRTVTRSILVAAVRLAPWDEGVIRPHEESDPAARAAALAEIVASRAVAAPVLAGYRDAAREVDRLLRGVDAGAPVAETVTADGTTHRLWRVGSNEAIGKLRPLFAPKKLHVLAGHARYEAMLAYAASLGADALPQYSSAKYGLGCLVNLEDPTLEVAAYHRVVRGEGIARDRVLDAARAFFIVERLTGSALDPARQLAAVADSVAHQPAFVVTFGGDVDAWKLTLKPDTTPVSEGAQVHRGVQRYDPVVLEQLLLARCAPGGAATLELDAAAVIAAVGAGASMGVVLRPLTLDQLLHADELGTRLPAGSGAVLPPLASLVSFVVDPDEDLV